MIPQKKNSEAFNLAIDAKLLIIGFIAFLILFYFSETIETIFFKKLFEHLSYAILIATIVGFGVDRLFHTYHLKAIVDEMPSALEVSLRRTGGRYQVIHMNDSVTIYNNLCAAMNSHGFMLTTTVDTDPRVEAISGARAHYYDEKVKRIAEGNLRIKEIVSQNVRQLVEDQLQKINNISSIVIDPGFLNTIYDSREINLGTTATFINFCVFLKDPSNKKEGLVMFGWFSDQNDTFQRHSCIFSDHPDLIHLFASYFDILHRSGQKIFL